MNTNEDFKPESQWHNFIPWFITIASSIVMIAIGYFLVANMNWFKNTSIQNGQIYSELYKIHNQHLFISTLKRLIGFFASFCLIFIGTGASFYAMKKISSLSGEVRDIKVSLITTSPGIVAMVLGVILMTVTITSKDSFPDFQPNSYSINSATQIEQGTDRTATLRK